MAGAPLLPRALRDAWAHEELPAWLQAELSEAGARRFSDLSVSAISPGKSLSERGKALLVWHVKSRLAEIQDLPAVSDLNLQVSVDFIPWTTRTRNAVRSAVWKRQLPASPLDWTLLRIRDFMAIPNLGPVHTWISHVLLRRVLRLTSTVNPRLTSRLLGRPKRK